MTASARAGVPGGAADERAKRGARAEGRPSVGPRLVTRLRRVGHSRRLRAIGSGSAATYQAAAALPHQNRGRATEALRDQLTIMAHAARLTPDWSTLVVTGPTEMTGTQYGARFEWTGRVAMRGSSPLLALPDPDVFPQQPSAGDATVPFGGPGWAERFRSTQAPDRRPPSEIASRAAA
jgi:hypothetical protein